MDAAALQGVFQCIFAAFLFASMGTFACFQLTREKPLWQAVIRSMTHIPFPSQLGSLEHCMYAYHVCFLENLYIWNPVLPFNVEEPSEAPHVEGAQVLCMVTEDSTSHISIQQRGNDNCTVHLEFSLQSNTSSFPNMGFSLSKAALACAIL